MSCVSDEPVEQQDIASGHVLDVALQDHAKLAGWRVFLCGNPNMVKAAIKDIYADAFLPSA